MKNGFYFLVLAICLLTLGTTSAFGEESASELDTVLSKWEQASRQIWMYDAEFTQYDYSAISPTAEHSEGRFYFETPHCGSYSDDSIALVWTREGLSVLQHCDKTGLRWSSRYLELMRQDLEQMPERTFWQRLWKGYHLVFAWPGLIATPDDAFPLLMNTDTQAQRQRFDFSFERRDGQIFLTAVPKRTENVDYREITVLLDATSFTPLAHQKTYSSGARTVHVFSEIKLNTAPADRDTLLSPGRAGYDVNNAEIIALPENGIPQEK